MKRRLGFVSNSSSASFVIQTAMKECDFYDFIKETLGYSVFYRDDFEELLKNEIKKVKEEIAEYKKKDGYRDKYGIEKLWESQCRTRLGECKKLLKKLPKMSEEELVRAVLKYRGVGLGIDLMGTISLSSFTTMYNDMDDMGEMMIKILAALAFSFGGNGFNCSVNDDGGC